MTEPEPRPQPEPVLNAATVGGAVSGLVSAGGMFFVFYGFTTADRVAQFSRLTAAIVAAAVAAIAALAPYVAALRARNRVTPIGPKAIPRDASNRRLVPVDEYGRHAKKLAPPPPRPSAVQQQVQRGLDHLRDRYGPDPDDDRDVESFIDDIHRSLPTQELPRAPRRRLGRKPPTGAPRIKLTASMVPAAELTPPIVVDWYSKVPASSWGVDGNDAVGDCTLAEVDHSTKARQVAAGNPEVRSTVDEVLAAYSEVTGYDPSHTRPDGSNPTDQGAVMQDVRDFWRKNGIILGGQLDRLTLFAEVDHTDLDLIRWCVARFGAVALGIDFPDTAMNQFDNGEPWDVQGGARIEGGHAISMIGYDVHFAYVVTWGRVQPMTWAFFKEYVEEAWTDISADWLNTQSGRDPLGEVAYALGEQFTQVTGKPNPFPAPAPAPEPPAPAPEPAPAALPPDVTAWARRVAGEKWAAKRDQKAARELLDWMGK